ncbi:MAG: hypothetical protein ACTSX4_03190 [Candidatus Helarchaeota archaeon]
MDKKLVCCPGCSIICDDIHLEIENGKIQHVLNSCTKGFVNFAHIDKIRLISYQVKEDGNDKTIDFQQSINTFENFLKNSKKPLFMIGKNNTCEDIEKTFELAKKVNGIISCPSARSYLNFFLKLKNTSIEIPTYDEMIDYVDTMIFWGSNPSSTHLRHASKFSALTRGKKITKGKEDRFIVLVDVRKTEVRALSDEFIQIEPHKDIELINALIDLANDKEVTSLPSTYPVKELITTHKYLMKSDIIVFFIGDGLLNNDDETIEKFFELVETYKKKGLKVKIMPMVETFGINNYIAASLEKTGGKSTFDFEKNEEVDLLNEDIRQEIDLIIYLNYDPIENLAFNSFVSLLKKKSVCLTIRKNWISLLSDLSIPVLINLIETPGTAKRLDQKDIKQEAVISPKDDLKSISEILDIIKEKF